MESITDGEPQQTAVLDDPVLEQDAMLLALLENDVRHEVLQRTHSESEINALIAEVISVQIGRFYWLLMHGYRALHGVFSEQELLSIAETIQFGLSRHSELINDGIVFMLRGAIQYNSRQFDKLDVDGDELLSKLEALDPLARYALVDVTERWWAFDSEERTMTITSILESEQPPRDIHVSF